MVGNTSTVRRRLGVLEVVAAKAKVNPCVRMIGSWPTSVCIFWVPNNN